MKNKRYKRKAKRVYGEHLAAVVRRKMNPSEFSTCTYCKYAYISSDGENIDCTVGLMDNINLRQLEQIYKGR